MSAERMLIIAVMAVVLVILVLILARMVPG